MDKYNEELGLKIPAHVAVILDGNGRWAKKKHMPRTYGHMQGSKVVEDMLYVADDLGIQYFTVYAFSTENWKRSKEEVDALVKQIMFDIHTQCVKYGKQADGYVNYVKGANVAGFMKVAKAMMAQGIL